MFREHLKVLLLKEISETTRYIQRFNRSCAFSDNFISSVLYNFIVKPNIIDTFLSYSLEKKKGF